MYIYLNFKIYYKHQKYIISQKIKKRILFISISKQHPNMNLTQLLQNPDISVPQLFNTPGILSQLKQKITTFIQFCKNNQQFTRNMIALGIKTPMHQHADLEMKKIAHVAIDLLTCDSDVIAQLFIKDNTIQRIRCYSQEEDQVIEEIVSNQQTGQLVIADRTTCKSQNQPQKFNKKYLYLQDLLSYLTLPEIDQNCLNYLSKTLNTIIRVKPQQLFTFFTQKPQILKHMVELTNYPSISYSIVKIINQSDDKKYRQFKLQLVEMVIKEILGQISSKQFGQYMEFVQEVFQKNRHRGEEKDQIKIVTQPLVSKQVIESLITSIFNSKSTIEISNSLLYLLKVVQRMNIDQQQDPYSYSQPSQQAPTMDFQVSQLFTFTTINKLLELSQKINRQHYSSNQILTYYDLLLAITKNSRWKQIKVDRKQSILGLLKVINQGEREYNGIIKNKIVSLIQLIYNKQQNLQNNNNNSNSSLTQQQLLEILAQMQKLPSNTKQSLCYKQKLYLILSPNLKLKLTNTVHQKYSSTLAPTSYTENRSFIVKQLQFVKNHSKIKEKVERQEKEREKQNQTEKQTEKQNQKQRQHQKQTNVLQIVNNINQHNTSINRFSITQIQQQQYVITQQTQNIQKQPTNQTNKQQPINISLLNDKINAIKSKKQQKNQQQYSNKKQLQQTKQSSIVQQQQSKQQITNNSSSVDCNNSINQKTNKNQIIVSQLSIKKQSIQQSINYFVKYLILY